MKDRKELIHALECIWAGVPDNLKKVLDAQPEYSVVGICCMVGGLRKVRDCVMAERMADSKAESGAVR